MNKSINLVSNRNLQVERELLILKLVRVVAVSLLITISVVAISAFILSTQISLASIKQEENTTLSQISALHDKLTTYYLTKDRLSNISTILASRKDYGKPITAILQKVPEDLTLEGISIEKEALTISAFGTSLVSINKLIDDISLLGKENKVLSNVKLQSLVLDVKGNKYVVYLKGEAL